MDPKEELAMKLGKSVLLEIMDIVREGLVTQTDISQKLRELDVSVRETGNEPPVVELSVDYCKAHPRAGEWEETN
jgi:hypothetical protein